MGAKGHSRESMTVEPPSLSGCLSGNSSVLVAAVLAALVVAWAATNLVLGGEGFAVLVSDKVVDGEEAASALARLFAALVLGLFLADAVALGALCPAAKACVGCRSRSLLAESPWASAELVAHCGGASRRVGLARLPVAFGLRRRPAYHCRRPQPGLRGGGRDRRRFRAPTRRLRARQASGYRAGARGD